jgi:steroid delta-isomerase-like uncharacterized protein
MAMLEALERYFDGWNDHDPVAVVASLCGDGTYEDPVTGAPIGGEMLAGYVGAILVGFPDLSFVIESVDASSDTQAVARWRMRGTNTGPTPDRPPTGGTVDLPGVDLLTYDPDQDRVRTVVGYFDTATMYHQLGLQTFLMPNDMEPVLAFGTSGRVETGRDAVPGAFTVTWIEIDPEHAGALGAATERIVMQELGNDDYLGSCFVTVGRRNYTFTAWTSVEAAKRALKGGAHGEAMRLATGEGLGANARGITSFWSPVQLNDTFSPGGAIALSDLGGQWL